MNNKLLINNKEKIDIWVEKIVKSKISINNVEKFSILINRISNNNILINRIVKIPLYVEKLEKILHLLFKSVIGIELKNISKFVLKNISTSSMSIILNSAVKTLLRNNYTEDTSYTLNNLNNMFARDEINYAYTISENIKSVQGLIERVKINFKSEFNNLASILLKSISANLIYMDINSNLKILLRNIGTENITYSSVLLDKISLKIVSVNNYELNIITKSVHSLVERIQINTLYKLNELSKSAILIKDIILNSFNFNDLITDKILLKNTSSDTISSEFSSESDYVKLLLKSIDSELIHLQFINISSIGITIHLNYLDSINIKTLDNTTLRSMEYTTG